MLEPANERFRGPAERYKNDIINLIQQYEPYFPTSLINILPYFDFGIKWYYPQRYGEIQGFSDILGLDKDLVLMGNFIYEFSSFCTSLIVKMSNGTIFHERNLDFTFPDQMRNITYIAKFY